MTNNESKDYRYRIEYWFNGKVMVWHHATNNDIITLCIELKAQNALGDDMHIIEIRQEH